MSHPGEPAVLMTERRKLRDTYYEWQHPTKTVTNGRVHPPENLRPNYPPLVSLTSHRQPHQPQVVFPELEHVHDPGSSLSRLSTIPALVNFAPLDALAAAIPAMLPM